MAKALHNGPNGSKIGLLEREKLRVNNKLGELEITCSKHPDDRQFRRDHVNYAIAKIQLGIQCEMYYIKHRKTLPTESSPQPRY